MEYIKHCKRSLNRISCFMIIKCEGGDSLGGGEVLLEMGRGVQTLL